MLVLLVILLFQHGDLQAYAANLKGGSSVISGASPAYFGVVLPDLESFAIDTSNAFRRQYASEALSTAKMTASHAARNLLVSVLLLIGIVVAASFTLRQSVDPGKSYRQCPFVVYLPGYQDMSKQPEKSKFEGDGVEEGKSLAEAVNVDWDKVGISNKFACIFDPSKLPIDNLMSLPPPSFKSKMDVGKEHFQNIFTPTSNEYVSISE